MRFKVRIWVAYYLLAFCSKTSFLFFFFQKFASSENPSRCQILQVCKGLACLGRVFGFISVARLWQLLVQTHDCTFSQFFNIYDENFRSKTPQTLPSSSITENLLHLLNRPSSLSLQIGSNRFLTFPRSPWYASFTQLVISYLSQMTRVPFLL